MRELANAHLAQLLRDAGYDTTKYPLADVLCFQKWTPVLKNPRPIEQVTQDQEAFARLRQMMDAFTAEHKVQA